MVASGLEDRGEHEIGAWEQEGEREKERARATYTRDLERLLLRKWRASHSPQPFLDCFHETSNGRFRGVVVNAWHEKPPTRYHVVFLQVLVPRMEAHQQDRCELMRKVEPLRDSMGYRSWTDLPRGFEDLKERDYAGAYGGKDGQYFDMQGLPNSGFALSVPPSGIRNQNSGDFFVQAGSPGASYSSGTSYDCNSAGNVDSAEDASLSSYLMDGRVRALLKKVTVNEEVLNQTIQSLGGGEKGLKELIGYIMLWLKVHKGENCDNFFSSHNLKKLHPLQQQVNPAFGYASSMTSSSATFKPTLGNEPYDQRNDRMRRTLVTVQSSEEALDPNQFYQLAKSRRLMDDGEVDSSIGSNIHSGRGTFVDVRGSTLDESRFPRLERSTESLNSIGQGMLSEMPRELDVRQPVPCLQPGLSFSSGYHDLSRNLAATTRAARRSRIARQRQSAQQGYARTPSNGTVVSSGCGIWSIGSPSLDASAGMFHPGTQIPSGVPAGSGRKVHNVDTLTFLLQKELRPSDVGNLGRIILPKKEAEMHLPLLTSREGVSLLMEDFDSGYCWTIRYRFWPNNKSRMYLLENTGDFVKSHHLEEGDLLILYKNQQGNYVLVGKKKVHSESKGAQGLQQKNAHSLARGFPEASSKTEDVLKERDNGAGLDDRSCPKVKAEPTVLVGDDDPFFKEDLMHNIGSSFGPGLLQPLERFPSLNLDFPLDEIIVGVPEDDNDTESEPNSDSSKVVVIPKTEPAG